MARILLTEDDPRTVELVRELLETSGHTVQTAGRVDEALAMFEADPPDLVVLDLNLPDRDGLELCATISARSHVPILILSARGATDDRVKGLRLGADDFLSKPYDPRELLARIDAVGRRAWPAEPAPAPTLEVGALTLDPTGRTVTLEGTPVELTAAEFDILRVLAQRAGRVVSRERLTMLARGAAWGPYDRALDVHVSRIRKKLGDDPRAPHLIKTVRGVGYVLVNEPC